MIKKILALSFLCVFLTACASPPPPPAPKPEPKKVVQPRVSQHSLDCRAKLKRFRELGVETTNINEILDRGLLETDFIGSVANEAFQVLAEARQLGCKY